MMQSLIKYVQLLENKDRFCRGNIIIEILQDELGLHPSIQQNKILSLRNIIVDFDPSNQQEKLILSAHYDKVNNSPGANDNASGVAVLLGICDYLKNKTLPIRVLFFDREEAFIKKPVKLGLLGSLYYVTRNNLHIKGVCNIEFCGQGDCLVLWSFKECQNIPLLALLRQIATKYSIPCITAYVPWMLFTSDHLSFRLKGVKNSLSISLVPSNQLNSLEQLMYKTSWLKILKKDFSLPEPLSYIHTQEDNSSKLQENSLQSMLTILAEVINAG